MLLFDLQFRYDDEVGFRPYVVNCDISELQYYVERVSSLSSVAQINIDIFSSNPVLDYEFYEYTI